MKKIIIKIVLILLIIIEGIYLILPNHKFIDKIEQVLYENNNINNKSTLAYYLNGESQEDRNTWPTESQNIVYEVAECYDENNSPIKASEIVSFNYENHTATITTKKTVYCSLYFMDMTSPKPRTARGIAIKSEANGTLESEDALAVRNKTITGNIKDDLRRFIGTKDEVTDNFICFGTDSQIECKNNMDLYMYRIIGVDTAERLKIIKATALVQGSSTSTFNWYSTYSSNITWQNSYLYQKLNGTYSSSGNIFIGNEKYPYMQNEAWTNLINTPTYYIGVVESGTNKNPAAFQNERSSKMSNPSKIGLMYLSDYLYAGSDNSTNWLFIQNGLNGKENTPSGSIDPTKLSGEGAKEWTMTYKGWDNVRGYGAWVIYSDGWSTGDYTERYHAVRPVFYLTSDISIIGGTGDIETPYIISPQSE